MGFGRVYFAAAMVSSLLSFGSGAFGLQASSPGQRYEYDLRGRLISTTYEDCSVIEFSYDQQGNRVTRSVVPPEPGDCEANSAPVFSTPANVTVSENSAGTVYTASASDPDGDPILYSISGGADAARFAINASSGIMSFTTPPDFETPSDSGGNNIYNVRVQASDGAAVGTLNVTVIVTNLDDEGPVWTSGGVATAAEGQTSTSYTAQASDLDSNDLAYSIHAGTDAALFTISPSTGVLSFVSPQDYEAPDDSNSDGVYQVTLRATAGGQTANRAVAVTLVDGVEFAANGAPTAVADVWWMNSGDLDNILVLNNDEDPDEDDTLAIVSVDGPFSYGYASFVEGGSTVQYFAHYTTSQRVEHFTYTISDGHGHTATGNVTVHIEAENGN